MRAVFVVGVVNLRRGRSSIEAQRARWLVANRQASSVPSVPFVPSIRFLASQGKLQLPTRRVKAKSHIEYHKDGSIWARGQKIGDLLTSYWEWFRKDGTILRSGSFDEGKQVGEWTTHDKQGRVYKRTTMKVGSK